MQEEWFEVDQNWISHSGVCQCLCSAINLSEFEKNQLPLTNVSLADVVIIFSAI
jgi:hypothetical protein